MKPRCPVLGWNFKLKVHKRLVGSAVREYRGHLGCADRAVSTTALMPTR
jgi:hypothetical protein